VDSGDGVAILTDMFGGTPSNLAISCMSRPESGSARRYQSSNAGRTGQDAPGTFPAQGCRYGRGGLWQIRHHRQRVLVANTVTASDSAFSKSCFRGIGSTRLLDTRLNAVALAELLGHRAELIAPPSCCEPRVLSSPSMPFT
jgi:hypothetical protein